MIKVPFTGIECQRLAGFESSTTGGLHVRVFHQPHLRNRLVPAQWTFLPLHRLSGGSLLTTQHGLILWLIQSIPGTPAEARKAISCQGWATDSWGNPSARVGCQLGAVGFDLLVELFDRFGKLGGFPWFRR